MKMDDELKWIFLIRQMEDNQKENDVIANRSISKEEIIDLIKPNIEYIRKQFNVSILCLYGSAVKEIMSESSDVDFLICFNDGLIEFEKGNYREKLSNYLKDLLKCKVDLVYFDHALKNLDINEMENTIVLIK